MAEADAEDWLLADELLDLFDDLRHVSRVAGAVREENAVRVHGEHFLCRRVRRNDRDFEAEIVHRLDDVLLDAEVHRDDKRRIFLLALERVGLRRRDFHDDVLLDGHGEELVDLRLRGILGDNDALHRAGIADLTRDSARVDVVEARDALFCQKVREACLIVPVAAVLAADDEAIDERLARLHEDVRNAVVADHRIRQRQDLAAVRRVRQAFLIADHAGIEDNFTRCLDIVQEFPVEYAAVFQDQFSFHSKHLANQRTTPSFMTTLPSTIVRTGLPVSARPAKGEWLPLV